MPSFAVSISILSLVQAGLVALPATRPLPSWLGWAKSPWWALIPALSIAVVIAVIELDSASATWLSYLALIAVPPLAAYALGALIHGSNTLTSPFFANSATKDEVSGWGWGPPVVIAGVLFALAWADRGSLAGEAAAMALSGLACITLGWLLVSIVPALWLRLGVYAMAAIDTWFVASDLLQGPNAVLSTASPAADLPRLQAVHFGSAQMGFGDLFVAALVGCLLAADGPEMSLYGGKSSRRQRVGALLVAGLALAFDLFFFAVDELPATVPVAVALFLVQRSAKPQTI